MSEQIEHLRQYSARWGSDANLVQGAGGNTSIKHADLLTVKASGMRLGEALEQEIFVTVRQDEACSMIDGGPLPHSSGLRPSIETSLHAIMPHAAVAHLHMVSVLAFAVRSDAEATLTAKLSGLNWRFIPYLKPGAEVAQAVRALVKRDRPDLIVLGNHGVVFGGDTFEQIAEMISDVEARLMTDSRFHAPDLPRLVELATNFGLEVARDANAHLAATHPVNLAFATTGTLYPDHVIFLGRAAAQLDRNGTWSRSESLLYLVPEAGALLADGLNDQAHEMAGCLGAIVARIDASATISTLTRAEENELVNWEAEIYRHSLSRQSH